jgi:hypothetical protein
MSRAERFKSKGRRQTEPVPRSAAVETHTHSFSVADITGQTENVGITTFVDRALSDNRRRYRDEVIVDPPSPLKRQRAERTHAASITISSPAADNEAFVGPSRYEMGFDADDEEPPQVIPRGPKIIKYSVCLHFFGFFICFCLGADALRLFLLGSGSAKISWASRQLSCTDASTRWDPERQSRSVSWLSSGCLSARIPLPRLFWRRIAVQQVHGR